MGPTNPSSRKPWSHKEETTVPFFFQPTSIEQLTLITPLFLPDSRGYLAKTFESGLFASQGISFTLAEELESKSCRNTLRGLHFQRSHSQDKLVRVLSGEVFDVAVDLRPGSSTYGKWHGVVLSAQNKKQFFVPKNFAHGFLVLSDYAEFAYKCSDFYHPGDEGGLKFDDPDIGVKWPIEAGAEVILSDKDKKWGGIREYTQSRENG